MYSFWEFFTLISVRTENICDLITSKGALSYPHNITSICGSTPLAGLKSKKLKNPSLYFIIAWKSNIFYMHSFMRARIALCYFVLFCSKKCWHRIYFHHNFSLPALPRFFPPHSYLFLPPFPWPPPFLHFHSLVLTHSLLQST